MYLLYEYICCPSTRSELSLMASVTSFTETIATALQFSAPPMRMPANWLCVTRTRYWFSKPLGIRAYSWWAYLKLAKWAMLAIFSRWEWRRSATHSRALALVQTLYSFSLTRDNETTLHRLILYVAHRRCHSEVGHYNLFTRMNNCESHRSWKVETNV